MYAYARNGHKTLNFFVFNVVLPLLASFACLPSNNPSNILVQKAPLIEYSSKESFSKGNRHVESINVSICQSENCKAISKFIQTARNLSVDPCENFYEYACGNWIKNNPVPRGKIDFSRFDKMSLKNERDMTETLLADKLEDTDTIKKVKNFYRSCLNLTKIDDLGSKPLLNYIDSLGSWSLSDEWKPQNWDFYYVLAKVQKDYPIEAFFSVDVIQDPVEVKGAEKKKYIILIDEAPLNVPQIVYFTDKKILREMRQYMSYITSLVGVSYNHSKDAMEELFVFESKLALHWVPEEMKRYVRVPLGKFASVFSEFPWLEHLRYVLSQPDLSNHDMVIVLANNYFQEMINLLRRTDKKVLSNYIIWRAIRNLVPHLSKEFRKAHQEFKERLRGKRAHTTRGQTCYSFTNDILGPMFGGVFIRTAFRPKSKEKVEVMLEGIIQAFEDRVSGVDWIDKQTVEAVREKADAVLYKVGYPDYLWNDTTYAQRYNMLNITVDHWLQNLLNTAKFVNHQLYSKLGKPVDKQQWQVEPQMINALYDLSKNEIVVPAGILQPPLFYAYDIPRSVSYGAIGHVLGHEFTHGYDTRGRKYDKNGEKIEKRTRWSESSIEAFQERAKCLVEQFSQYKVLNKFHISGEKTLEENIADLGGLNLAYHAYTAFTEKNGEEQILPELNMTNKELFFIGYAQKWCTSTTPVAELLTVTVDTHSPPQYRVIGSLANFQEFSDVFRCKVGSEMNPKKKCEVW